MKLYCCFGIPKWIVIIYKSNTFKIRPYWRIVDYMMKKETRT